MLDQEQIDKNENVLRKVLKLVTGSYDFRGVLNCDVTIHDIKNKIVVVSDVALAISDDVYGHTAVGFGKKVNNLLKYNQYNTAFQIFRHRLSTLSIS